MDPLRGEQQPNSDPNTMNTHLITHPNPEEDSLDDDQQHCIYTYKGGGVADLPASFWEFEGGDTCPNGTSNPPSTSSGASSCGAGTSKSPNSLINGHLRTTATGSSASDQLYSPDNDFLEMDFDPGEPEEEEDQVPSAEFAVNRLLRSQVEVDVVDGPAVVNNQSSPAAAAQLSPHLCQEPPPCSSTQEQASSPSSNSPTTAAPPQPTSSRPRPQLNLSSRLVKSNTLPKMGVGQESPTSSSSQAAIRSTALSYSLPLIENERGQQPASRTTLLLSSSSSTTAAAPSTSLMLQPTTSSMLVGDVMLWSREEAMLKAVGQIGVSACGATAVLNVLSALGFPAPTLESLHSAIHTRLRLEDGDLPQYLESRSVAGTTHVDLASGIQELTSGAVRCHFFRVHPGCSAEELSRWLLGWVCRGAVPILTRNLQIQPSSDPPADSWHHQMLYGLGPGVVYLTNPLEAVPVQELLPQLTSECLLLVRREDVIGRMRPRTDLRKLVRMGDGRWNELNVLGQVANMLLEQSPLFSLESAVKRTRTGHVSIPYSCVGGVLLCIRSGGPYEGEFEREPEVIGEAVASGSSSSE